MTIKNTIVGQTTLNGEIIPHQPIIASRLFVGDIVFVCSDTHDIPPQWYRVYDGGDKGLRFWCITATYADAVQTYERECWQLEDAAVGEVPYMAGHYENGY